MKLSVLFQTLKSFRLAARGMRAPEAQTMRLLGRNFLTSRNLFHATTRNTLLSPVIYANIWVSSFLALVLAPSAIFLLYSVLWQTYGFEAEARVTVRGAQEFRGATSDAAGILSKITSGSAASKMTVQDAHIVLNYIKSSAIILDLGGAAYMERYFGGSTVDFFSRIAHDATIEELKNYWLKRVSANLDSVSGIVKIKVEAFSPIDSRDVVKDIISRSELLINAITERSRNDAAARAELEVKRAAEKLAATREKLTVFRDASAIFDPASRAKTVADAIAKLTLDKIAVESAMATLEGSLKSNSPTQRIQQSKLDSIAQQIDALSKLLTNPNDNNALSAQLATFERLKIDEQFDELMYTIAQSSYQRSRQELERMQLYLVVVVPPFVPGKAIYPKIFANNILLFGALFVFWSIGALIIASINDQML